MSPLAQRRKLIEVSLPLEEINAEAAREKSIRHGHPSTLHLWWARRPLAACRAVLFAQLVDDPSWDSSLTEDEQHVERERLHNLIRRLVKWENINDEALYREAHAEIVKSAPQGSPPAILDPFAGGGSIPLEAQRLGLEAHASDLNPVAVLINKALIEIPPKFAGQPPVFVDDDGNRAAETRMGAWPRATGLAEDVRRYGTWMREQAQQRIGDLYPKATLPDGSQATVIAWIWARTVTCPNPACGIQMPLLRSWWLGKKKGKEAYVVPHVVDDPTEPSGRRIRYSIGHDPASGPMAANDGTVRRTTVTCVGCGTATSLTYVREQGRKVGLGQVLTAVVAEGNRRRIYLAPTTEQATPAAEVQRPDSVPSGALPPHSLSPNSAQTVTIYGFEDFVDFFTNRQLVALTTFSDLVGEAREKVLVDALSAGLPRGDRLADGGTDAEAYADAVATYIGFAISRMTNKNSAVNSWDSSPKMEAIRSLFARQAIPMAWDFAEANPFGGSSGDFTEDLKWVAMSLDRVPASGATVTMQADATSRDYSGFVISTDPPYYDNIGYSDLSDFFYVWLRRSLRSVYPSLFSTMLVPKAEELVANPYRHGGKDAAEHFFESGFEHVFGLIRVAQGDGTEAASSEYPMTVFYAFKQKELQTEGLASTGWSTFLEGMIREGWTITATWPVRSELSNRMLASGTNALASSIVLALRPRVAMARATDRTGFLMELRTELAAALPRLREGSIAPVDLRQAILGPGMAVFSRYSRVLEDDGSPMRVKTALALINQEFDAIENERDSDLDDVTRFCLDWFRTYRWEQRPSSDAESLALAFGTSESAISRSGVLTSGGGKARLIRPQDLAKDWNPATDDHLSQWEVACHLAQVYAAEGREAAARLLAGADGRVAPDVVQRLATRLYEVMEQVDPATAGLFNGLGAAWADIAQTAARLPPETEQGKLDL